jgi:NAD(P)H dehydrogenase (quinone)
MILLTGAAGKTGRTIIKALTQSGSSVKAYVRSNKQAEEIKLFCNIQVVVGDLRDVESLASSLDGIDKIYFICPNMAPDEMEIGRNLLTLAKARGISRFVYHSVLHPQVEAMPHHWQKMRMEELVFDSGLDFTILQPCAYMQNIMQYWNAIINESVYAVPYATSAQISIVDLEDVAQVAACVLMEDTHQFAIYELAGPQPLSQDEVAQILNDRCGRNIVARVLDRTQWSENVQKAGMSDYQRNTLLMMFEYYESHGLIGNPKVLEMLLNRPATTFTSFINRQLSLEKMSE